MERIFQSAVLRGMERWQRSLAIAFLSVLSLQGSCKSSRVEADPTPLSTTSLLDSHLCLVLLDACPNLSTGWETTPTEHTGARTVLGLDLCLTLLMHGDFAYTLETFHFTHSLLSASARGNTPLSLHFQFQCVW